MTLSPQWLNPSLGALARAFWETPLQWSHWHMPTNGECLPVEWVGGGVWPAAESTLSVSPLSAVGSGVWPFPKDTPCRSSPCYVGFGCFPGTWVTTPSCLCKATHFPKWRDFSNCKFSLFLLRFQVTPQRGAAMWYVIKKRASSAFLTLLMFIPETREVGCLFPWLQLEFLFLSVLNLQLKSVGPYIVWFLNIVLILY